MWLSLQRLETIVLRIHLDQNKWIDLARAFHGRDNGSRFQEVLALCLAAVDSGRASFPLCSARYMENANTRDVQRRVRLAQTMARVSRYHAIAPESIILPVELDAALQRRFGRPSELRQCEIFGIGAGHAMGQPGLNYAAPGSAALSPTCRKTFETILADKLEFNALSFGNSGDTAPGRMADFYRNRYSTGQAAIGEAFHSHNLSIDERKRTLVAQSILDIRAPLNIALHRANVSFNEFLALGSQGLNEFIGDLPTRHVDNELHAIHHQNADLRWEAGHLFDIASLSVALVFCDVVVTEKMWVDLIRRAHMDQRYDTILLSDLADLAPLLIGTEGLE